MARSTKSKPITADSVTKALESGAKSLSDIARSLGFKGRPGSTTTAAIRKAVPDVDERIRANKGDTKAKKPKTHPRHESNPYREGSAYATAFDVLAAAGSRGILRKDLVAETARVTGKPEKNAYFDVTVVLSPRETGEAHRSANRAADAYWVEKADGGNVKLRLRDRRF
jgi:hypothetical protein